MTPLPCYFELTWFLAFSPSRDAVFGSIDIGWRKFQRSQSSEIACYGVMGVGRISPFCGQHSWDNVLLVVSGAVSSAISSATPRAVLCAISALLRVLSLALFRAPSRRCFERFPSAVSCKVSCAE